MTIVTIADISSSQQLATSGFAKWIAFSSLSATSRVGDVNVGASQGVAVVAGASPLIFPPLPGVGQGYQLAEIYVYISGGTVQVTYGQ
jgi:hypothetical protein